MRACSRVALAAVLASATLPAFADWKDDYSRGLEAARDGRWADVSRYMENAIAGNAQPAPRLRLYGQRYEIYAPQHYAGLAALRQGNCAAALRFWSQAANESFVSANAALAGVEQQGRGECGTTAVASQPKPTPPPVQAPLAQAPATPAPAPPVQSAPPPSRPVVQAPPANQPSVPAPAPVEQRSVASAAAETLRPVLDAYLGGRYAEVLRLTGKPAGEARLRWHLCTLRAAAAWQMAQLDSTAANAGETARQAISDARAADPARRPDATFYSPRFVAFFNAPT